MAESQPIEQEKSVLRWGGLAGILGSITFILVFIIVAVFVGMDDVEPAEMILRFPDIMAARTVENGLYLLVLILWIPHFLALYRALRETSPATALFGSVLGIVGLTVLAAGALPHVATLPISNAYHAPGTTAEQQAVLVLIWQATLAMFDALLFAGLLVVPVGITSLGAAMLGSPAFGKGYGWLSVALGAIGIVGAIIVLIDPLSMMAVAAVFTLILFHLILGWKTYALSRAA